MLTKKTSLVALISLALGAGLTLPVSSLAASGGIELQSARSDVTNTASLQRGARNFVNYCLGCHSAKYVRYNRLGTDLGLSEAQMMDNLMFTGERPHDTMKITMQPQDAERWFGRAPPDLSLIARARGTDYIYTFLKSFYVDPSRPNGTNNLVLPMTAMPHVLWELQGYQQAVYDGKSDVENNAVHKEFRGFELVQKGTMTPAEFDQFVRDTVNFLDYVGEPMQLERRNLGMRVLAFLFVFFLFAYFLKKEYWKDVK